MKVAIVHDYLNQMGGAERVLEAFCELFPGAPVYTLIADPDKLPEKWREIQVKTSFIQFLPFAKKHYKKYLPLYPLAIEQFDFSGYDLVLSSSSAFAKGVLTNPDTIHICYCHTPLRYTWDLYHKYLREDGPGGIYAKLLPYVLHKIRLWDRISADRVDFFIANSHNVRRRIEKYYRREAEVIYPPVETGRFAIREEGPEDFFLIVSRLLPYKRVDIVIQAFNELKLPLIIIGDGYDRKRLEKMAGSTVRFLGYQPDEVVADYYARCQAFLFPGEEDFGITPLEAQASGRPVIAYRAGGALETVVEEKTGIFFDRQTKESVIDAVKKFQHFSFDPHTIRRHALQFDKEVFITKMKQYISKMIESNIKKKV